MKHRISILMLASVGLFTACEKNPIDNEQYKKMVYMVGAPDVIKKVELQYSGESQETFVSVSTSGSLAIENDIDVKLSINKAAVNMYNEKYFGPSKMSSYFRVLPADLYTLPTSTTIVAKEEIYKRVPVSVKTENLHPDSSYVIPISIESVSNYELNEELSTLLLTFSLVNKYSGDYSMEGRKTVNESATSSRIQKNKALKAVDEHTVRMYWADGDENNNALIPTHTLTLKVNPDNTVSIDAWDELEILDGGGTYRPETNEFSVWYTLNDQGNTIKVEETLQKIVRNN